LKSSQRFFNTLISFSVSIDLYLAPDFGVRIAHGRRVLITGFETYLETFLSNHESNLFIDEKTFLDLVNIISKVGTKGKQRKSDISWRTFLSDIDQKSLRAAKDVLKTVLSVVRSDSSNVQSIQKSAVLALS
jgi:hypothetical protein